MPGYGANNSLWVGNNYSNGFNNSATNRNGFPNSTAMPSWNIIPNYGRGLQSSSNVLRVIGPESAIEYQIEPNSQIVMLDSNRPVMYLKKSDDSGYSETKAYEYHEIPLYSEKPDETNANYISKSEFESFKNGFESMRKDLESMKRLIEELTS